LAVYYVLGNVNLLDKLAPPKIDTTSVIYILIPALSFGISNYIFKSLISKIDTKLSLEEKIAPYQSASIIRWAILEGAAFLIIIIKPDFLIFGVLLFIWHH